MASSLLPPFVLQSASGETATFPASKPALICFIKEDCQTCNLVMPILEHLFQSFHASIEFLIPGQTLDGNETLSKRHHLNVPLLDDSGLKVSFAYDIEIVPTLFLADDKGRQLHRLEGFVKKEWQALFAEIAELGGLASQDFDWQDLPDWRPGCGSLSVDPVNADRLQAESENSPLRARKIEIATDDDEFEFMFDQGFSDGLPLVPPTPERVIRMLTGTRRDPREVIATMPPNMGDVTVEKAAINAVMAGCKPEYLPVIIAGIEAVCTDEFNIHGVMATTMGASPVMIVNGPIREKIGMNMGLNALGQGNRANATIGRALRLVIRNVGGARPGGTERSTLGNPMKFTMCFAEWEERSPWDPLHVERGFKKQDSVVSIFTMTSGPTLVVDQTSRTAPQLTGSFGLVLESTFHPRVHGPLDVILVISPEHVDTLQRDNYSKEDIRNRIQEVTSVPLKTLGQDKISGAGMFTAEHLLQMPEDVQNRLVPKFASHENIHLVVAGSNAGKFSGVFHGWVTGNTGSIPVSKKIEEL